MKDLRYGSLLMRLLVLAALVLIPPVVVISWLSVTSLESGLQPELEGKALAVADNLSDQFSKALSSGIPLDRLVGVEDFLTPVLKANPEFLYLALYDNDGHRLYAVGEDTVGLDEFLVNGKASETDSKIVIGDDLDFSLPFFAKGIPVGRIHVGILGNYISGKIASILSDVAVLSVVFFLIASEILIYVVAINVSGPLGQIRRLMVKLAKGDFTSVIGVIGGDEVGHFTKRLNRTIRSVDDLYRRLLAYVEEVRRGHFDANAIADVVAVEERVKFLYRFSSSGSPQSVFERHALDIRLALFLFTFAEELSRSFLPLYIQSLPNPLPWFTPEMMMAVPIGLFMAMVAVFSPWAGAIAQRLGSRNVFHMGLLPAILGFILAGIAQDSVQIMVGRLASGLGYAMVTMAAQVYISSTVKDESRTQSMGVFVGAVLTASVCGSGLGGILVERVGFRGVFLLSSLLAVVAGLLAGRLPAHETARQAPRYVSFKERLGLLKNWRFSIIVLFAAIPSKIAVTGVVFFLAPLHLWTLGYGYADIAKMIMVYAVLVVILSPLVAKLADRTGWRLGLVAAGGVIGSAGLLAPAWAGGALPVVVALACLGIANGLAASPQLALIPDVCWIECRTLGQSVVLAEVRRLERIGSVLGPLVAAALVPFMGFGWAIVGLGVVLLSMSVIFLLTTFQFGTGIHIATEEVDE